MGDHVTAFGVHVVNLRHAMQGKNLKDARNDLQPLVNAVERLPGWALIDTHDSAWRRQWAALKSALTSATRESEDVEIAALQRSALPRGAGGHSAVAAQHPVPDGRRRQG